jgi:hypothetical protein
VVYRVLPPADPASPAASYQERPMSEPELIATDAPVRTPVPVRTPFRESP